MELWLDARLTASTSHMTLAALTRPDAAVAWHKKRSPGLDSASPNAVIVAEESPCVQLSRAAALRIAQGLALALKPWLGHLECSSCGSQTSTTWCEGRSCRHVPCSFWCRCCSVPQGRMLTLRLVVSAQRAPRLYDEWHQNPLAHAVNIQKDDWQGLQRQLPCQGS